MFDARQVLETVRDGKAPTDWRVFHTRPAYVLLDDFSMPLIAGVTMLGVVEVAAVLLLASDARTRASITLGTSGLAAIVVALGVLFLLALGAYISRPWSARNKVLVLTPEGCVQGSIKSMTPTRMVSFSQLKSLFLNVAHVRYGPLVCLQLRPFSGSVETWWLDPHFGDLEALGEQIQYEFKTYQASHPQMQTS